MTLETGFVLFGTAHLVTLAIITTLGFLLVPLSRKVSARGWSKLVANVIAVSLIVYLLVKAWLWATRYSVPLEFLLPLQICDANVILCALMLFMRSYRVYEVAYFWAMAGSVVAMLTPDLLHGFPHLIYIWFFLGHGLVVIGALYATFVFNFRPRARSVLLALGITGLYALAILPLNLALGTNYLFLLAKPLAPSILDYFGPWPWYLLGLFVLTIVACYLCYAPFAVARYIKSKRRDHYYGKQC